MSKQANEKPGLIKGVIEKIAKRTLDKEGIPTVDEIRAAMGRSLHSRSIETDETGAGLNQTTEIHEPIAEQTEPENQATSTEQTISREPVVTTTPQAPVPQASSITKREPVVATEAMEQINTIPTEGFHRFIYEIEKPRSPYKPYIKRLEVLTNLVPYLDSNILDIFGMKKEEILTILKAIYGKLNKAYDDDKAYLEWEPMKDRNEFWNFLYNDIFKGKLEDKKPKQIQRRLEKITNAAEEFALFELPKETIQALENAIQAANNEEDVEDRFEEAKDALEDFAEDAENVDLTEGKMPYLNIIGNTRKSTEDSLKKPQLEHPSQNSNTLNQLADSIKEPPTPMPSAFPPPQVVEDDGDEWDVPEEQEAPQIPIKKTVTSSEVITEDLHENVKCLLEMAMAKENPELNEACSYLKDVWEAFAMNPAAYNNSVLINKLQLSLPKLKTALRSTSKGLLQFFELGAKKGSSLQLAELFTYIYENFGMGMSNLKLFKKAVIDICNEFKPEAMDQYLSKSFALLSSAGETAIVNKPGDLTFQFDLDHSDENETEKEGLDEKETQVLNLILKLRLMDENHPVRKALKQNEVVGKILSQLDIEMELPQIVEVTEKAMQGNEADEILRSIHPSLNLDKAADALLDSIEEVLNLGPQNQAWQKMAEANQDFKEILESIPVGTPRSELAIRTLETLYGLVKDSGMAMDMDMMNDWMTQVYKEVMPAYTSAAHPKKP